MRVDAALWPLRVFLPTPSARRATQLAQEAYQAMCISTHALREEGDLKPVLGIVRVADFYPRPPRGGRLYARSRSNDP